MNILGFLAIVIAVTGLVWLLQMIFKGKERIDINLSVGRSRSPTVDNVSKTYLSAEKTSVSGKADTDSILGDVVTFRDQIPQPTSPPIDHSVSTPSFKADQTDPDAYLDLVDENFEDHSNDSLLIEVPPGQLNPPLGQLAFSGFGSLAAKLPADSFEKPQSPEQIETMFAVLRESTRRIEEQMIALYEVHRSMMTNHTSTSSLPSADSQLNTKEDSGDYDFGDDDEEEPNEASFGGGLNAQLAQDYPVDESQTAPASEFLTMDELNIPMPADAIKSYDASEVLETAPEIRQEALPYFANINKTGELSYEVVEAIKRKAPTREVKHRVRQVLRAIDHFNFSGDSNAALRVTAVFRHLPRASCREFDNEVASIGRKFGLIEPDNQPDPVEAEDILES